MNTITLEFDIDDILRVGFVDFVLDTLREKNIKFEVIE